MVKRSHDMIGNDILRYLNIDLTCEFRWAIAPRCALKKNANTGQNGV
jgi:hypothetical protein